MVHDAAATVAADAGAASVSAPSLPVRARRAARTGVKAAAAAIDLVRREPDGLVILLYHQVGGPVPNAVNLSATRFRQQLAHLAGRGVATLDEGVAAVRRAPTPVGDHPSVVVTFDDGTADFVDVALPLLVDFAIPATLYVATRWVDEGRSFWDDGTVLSWAGLREAVDTGLVTIGSHTHSHALLDRLPADEIAEELDRSIGLIEDNLQVSPQHFAYPKALMPSPQADLAVRRRFRSAAIAGTRPNRFRGTDPFLLTRSPVQVADGMRWFRHKADGGMRLEDDLREVVNRRRYAGATR
jgi:peptidoglycan/xylan/chitin deacetylase (PgdA/CDA1 family)